MVGIRFGGVTWWNFDVDATPRGYHPPLLEFPRNGASFALSDWKPLDFCHRLYYDAGRSTKSLFSVGFKISDLSPPGWHCGKSSFSSQDTTLPHWLPTVEEARRTWTRRREFSLINRLYWTIFPGRELKNSLRLLCVWLPCAGSVIRPAVIFELAPMFIPRSVVCVRQHSLAGS